jgi:hypothetical protein
MPAPFSENKTAANAQACKAVRFALLAYLQNQGMHKADVMFGDPQYFRVVPN